MRFLLIWLLLITTVRAQNWESQLSPYEQQNLKKNRAWIAERQNQGEGKARVGVMAGAGVWNFGARCLVAALERSGTACQVLDPGNMPPLERFSAVVLPGGFAPVEYYGMGWSGCVKVADFTNKGGHVLGICAGGYLISRTVRYQSINYPYPLALFDGTAEGPVAGLPVYPNYGPIQLSLTQAGRDLGLSGVEKRNLLYGSGPRFVGGTGVTVLMNYSDGTPAAISRAYGKGKVVAMGAHLECPPELEGENVDPPAGCEKYLLKLLDI